VNAPTVGHRIPAPHVATLASIVAVGDRIDAGQRVASIAVLDEEQEVCSPVSGRVITVGAAAGDLIEYGQSLMVIEVTA
jgi:biotin carboxyl carrier protein